MSDDGIAVHGQIVPAYAAEDVFHVIDGEAGLVMAELYELFEFLLEILYLLFRPFEINLVAPVFHGQSREIGAELVQDTVSGA